MSSKRGKIESNIYLNVFPKNLQIISKKVLKFLNMCYNHFVMVRLIFEEKSGYLVHYNIDDEGKQLSMGILDDGEMITDKFSMLELGFRTLIMQCYKRLIENVKTKDIWGLKLEKFGFHKEGEYYVATLGELRLPHDCENK